MRGVGVDVTMMRNPLSGTHATRTVAARAIAVLRGALHT